MTTLSACCVIPTYNMAKYVGAAIESALCQTVPFAEIVVVDDGSQDETPDILSAFGEKISVVRQPNSGVSVARNIGLSATRSDLVNFLDADDLLHPRKLEVQLDVFARDADCWFCDARTGYFWSPDMTHADMRTDHRHADEFWRHTHAGHISSWLVRRDLFARTGVFEPGCAFSEDTDWLLRCRSVADGHMRRVHERLSDRRLHRRNATRHNRHAQVSGLLTAIHRKRIRAHATNT